MTQAPEELTVPPTSLSDGEPSFVSYWGVSTIERFDLPDGKQWFDIKPMDEGKKSNFQRLTNRGLRMNQNTNEAHMDFDPANERHTLIRQSVVDLNIFQPDPKDPRGFSEMPSGTERAVAASVVTLLDKFDPKVIQDLEFFIRTKNPWMQADMDIDQMYEEKARIEKLIEQHHEQKAGEGASSSS